MKALSNQSKQDYQTPRWVIDWVESWIGEKFDLDAAARGDNAICYRYISPPREGIFLPEELEHECIDDDALDPQTHWTGSLVWCNPPFAKPGPWIEKARTEVVAGHAGAVVMLLPASTSTNWFHDKAVPLSTGIILLTPRISYIGGNRSPAFGSMFVIFTRQPHFGITVANLKEAL